MRPGSRRGFRDRSGQALVEYAILLALVAVALIGALILLRDAVGGVYGHTGNQIEQAATPFQKVHISNLYEYEEKLKSHSFISPSLIIIGKVVALHLQFAWLKNSCSSEYYFKPVQEIKESVKLIA